MQTLVSDRYVTIISMLVIYQHVNSGFIIWVTSVICVMDIQVLVTVIGLLEWLFKTNVNLSVTNV